MSVMESILQQGPVRPVREVSVPQAMRPAVDLIARLAAERSRLRDDLQRLRDDVTSVGAPKEPRAPQPASELDALQAAKRAALRPELAREAELVAELARVSAERDALRREVDQLRGARAKDPFDGLLERLERVAGRLEGASAGTSSSRARRRPASGRVSREDVATPRSAARAPSSGAAPAQGGGMLGSLVAQNLALRPGSDRAQRASTPASAPRPQAVAPQRTPAPQARPANSGGGGFLGALVKQNLAVRSTPHGQPRAHAA